MVQISAIHRLSVAANATMGQANWDHPLPQLSGRAETNVRIYVGMAATGSDMSGDVPGVSVWDAQGGFLGHMPGGKGPVADGGFQDINVPHINPYHNDWKMNANPEYMSISDGGNDAICIAAVDYSFPDGSRHHFDGDLVHYCKDSMNKPRVFPSVRAFGGNNHRPYCFWIDRDGKNYKGKEVQHQGVGIHLPSFFSSEARAETVQTDKEVTCNSKPRIWMYDYLRVQDPITIFARPPQYTLEGGDADRNAILHPVTRLSAPAPWRKRSRSLPLLDRVKSWFERADPAAPDSEPEHPFQHTVIHDSGPEFSATDICADPHTWGPNYLSKHDGLFCEMASRAVYPVCGIDGEEDDLKKACFDAERDEVWIWEEGDGDEEGEGDDDEKGDDGEEDDDDKDDKNALPVSTLVVLPGAKGQVGTGPLGKKMQKKVIKKYTKRLEW